MESNQKEIENILEQNQTNIKPAFYERPLSLALITNFVPFGFIAPTWLFFVKRDIFYRILPKFIMSLGIISIIINLMYFSYIFFILMPQLNELFQGINVSPVSNFLLIAWIPFAIAGFAVLYSYLMSRKNDISKIQIILLMIILNILLLVPSFVYVYMIKQIIIPIYDLAQIM